MNFNKVLHAWFEHFNSQWNLITMFISCMASSNLNINDKQSQNLQNHTSHYIVDSNNGDKTLEIKLRYNPTNNVNAEIKTHWWSYCCYFLDLGTDLVVVILIWCMHLGMDTWHWHLLEQMVVHHGSPGWSQYCSCALIFSGIVVTRSLCWSE